MVAAAGGSYLYQTLQFPTQVVLYSGQVGMLEVTATATVDWRVLSAISPAPTVSFYFDGQPIQGCTQEILTSGTNANTAQCEFVLPTAEPYSLTAIVDPTQYFLTSTSPPNEDTPSLAYWLVGSDGSIYHFGRAPIYGSLAGQTLSAPIVGIAATPDDLGYWLVGSDGTVYSFGDALDAGSTRGTHLNAPIVGMAATPDGGGYWLVASDGGVFAFGDATFYGSTGGIRLNQPIVGMAVDPATGGYWLVASDGGIFSFNASFFGSTGGVRLEKPIVGMGATPSGGGYWLVARDGGLFTFGDAEFHGSAGGQNLSNPVVGMYGG